ncbi:MAG TPA: hypothetical protein CFH81_02140 [Sulfurovum sp. UBA12169]|nr:MAG TPA: hypothetical protein CFH81_02140 [Sulfurovum sp. UBA12169]
MPRNLTEVLTGEDKLTIKDIVKEDISDNLETSDATKFLSAKQGQVIKGFIDEINILLTSNDTSLDELQEIVNFIKINKTTLDTLGISNIAGLEDALTGKEPANSYLMKTNVAQTMTAQLTVKETKETYYAMTGTEINPANGTIQFRELTASATLTEVLESGQSITLMIKDADLYTLTLPTLTWCTTSGNVAPTWTGLDTIVLWKVSTSLFAAYLGSYE